MPNYRYIFADLLTNQVNMELPLYGVSFGRQLSKAGNFTGSFALDSTGYDNQDVIDATIPGRTAVYIDRDGSLVWGGILWSRTWQEQSKTFQWSGQTFESYFYKKDIRTTVGYTNTDQRNVVINLINHCQANPYSDIGVVLPGAFSNNILRTVNFKDYEVWTYGKALEYMAEYAEGLDYTIDVRWNSSGEPEKYLLVDDVLGAPIDTTQLVFDYPGGIKQFWYPESASKGATTMYGIGAGEGSAMPRIIITNQQLLNAGYPELVEFYTNKDVSVPTTLASKTAQEAMLRQVPIIVPTFELNPNVEPVFGSYQLGDYARMQIESPRFPGGKTISSRIIGWDVTPPRSDGQESLKIIVAGEDSSGE